MTRAYIAAYGDIEALSSEHLCERWLTPALREQAPHSKRTKSWLAGRVLLARLLQQPLPLMAYEPSGKPYFLNSELPFFNISHSGSMIIVVLSTIGPVGVDIEAKRERSRGRLEKIATEYFSAAENNWLNTQIEWLDAFWQLWVQREAYLKQQGLSVWQMSKLNEGITAKLAEESLYLFSGDLPDAMVAICGRQQFPLDFVISHESELQN